MKRGRRARASSARNRQPLTWLRGAGLAALVVLGVWTVSLTPEREVPWDQVKDLEVSDQDCEERREERQTGPFTLPASHPQPVPWQEVAEWFRIDFGHLCRANGLALAECAKRELTPGEELALPFRYHAPGPPLRTAKRERSSGT